LSWSTVFKILSLVAAAVLAWKVLVSPVTVDLSGIKATDLLAFLLAFFSIGLATAFYVQADAASKKFYHHSYEFSNHMSELLGRIEERFGKELAHLGEAQDEMASRMERLPVMEMQREGAQVQATSQEAKMREVLEEAMKKSRLDDKERRELLEKYKAAEAAAAAARGEAAQKSAQIAALEARLAMAGPVPPPRPIRALSTVDTAVLRVLSRAPPPGLRGQDIARQTGLAQTAVFRGLQHLAETQLIQRTVNRNSVKVASTFSITPLGSEVFAAAERIEKLLGDAGGKSELSDDSAGQV
jgi:DNA-binding MarR family transcriptional regulator